ncbi:MAG: glutamine amidotransferase [Gammaproteobacteria bacterium]|nr:glutamine amidotransferase [Gammaproteobacteria bacterium]
MRTIILLDHHDNLGDDIANQHLTDMGFNTDIRRPVNGDSLPAVNDEFHGVIIYGGAMNVTDREELVYLKKEIQWIDSCLKAGKKVLGICLGAQLIAHVLGAKVGPAESGLCEFGYYEIKPTEAGKNWIPDSFFVTQAHFQEFDIPEGATLLAGGEIFKHQAFKYGDNVFAFQFHPEISESIFNRWQDSDWAFFGIPGAQTREQQDEIKRQASHVQESWFRNFLDEFFV